VFSLCSIEMPRFRRHERVEAQSAAVEKLESSDLPSASPAIRAARCDIDLSPGKRSWPVIYLAGWSFIVSATVRERT